MSRLLCQTLAALVLALTASLCRADASATQGAFDALLALPQGLPAESALPSLQDGSIVDQATLRESLETSLEVGADINGYRYDGTLLHHALRANLQDTALWLLAHGADPRLELRSGGTAPSDGPDALQLAIAYRRWRVVDVLLRRPDVAPHGARDRAYLWTAVLHFPGDRASADDAARQMAKRVPWPGDWYGGCLLTAARDAVVLPMILAAGGAEASRRSSANYAALKGRDKAIAALCLPRGVNFFGPPPVAGRFAALSVPDLLRADARLKEPLLPVLVPLLATTADVRAWAALPLRRPWQDEAFARAVVRPLLLAPLSPEVRDAALRSVPASAVHAALNDDLTLHAWFESIAAMPEPQALAAIARIDDATLQQHAEPAVTGLADMPLDMVSLPRHAASRSKATPAVWNALLARLSGRTSLRSTLPILRFVPPAAWPALLALHVPSNDELRGLWPALAPDEWRLRWPQLQAAAGPNAGTALLGAIVAAWAKPCSGDDDDVAPHPDDADKIAWMLASGVPAPPAPPLSPTCAARVAPETLEVLVSTGIVALPNRPADAATSTTSAPVAAAAAADEFAAAAAPRGRFALAPLACSPVPDPAIVRAAIRGRFLLDGDPTPPREVDGPVAPDQYQPVDDPGARTCAWLVTGGYLGTRGSSDEYGFYDGHEHFSHCSGPTLEGEVWRVVDGRVVASALGDGASEGALQLKDADGPRRYVLALPLMGSRCSAPRNAELFAWSGDEVGMRLVHLSSESPALRTFERQCAIDDPGPCFGRPSVEPPPDAPPEASTPASPLTAFDFVAQHGAVLHRRWLAAFIVGDFAALQSPELAAVWPDWRREALAELTASALPLDEKRRRTAWMFRDKAGLAASFGRDAGAMPEVVALVPWLPREDWRPLLDAIGRNNDLLGALHDAALARKYAGLTCAFTRAAGDRCTPANSP